MSGRWVRVVSEEFSGDAEDAFTCLKRIERVARRIGAYDLTQAVMLTDIRELHDALRAYADVEIRNQQEQGDGFDL